MHGKTMGLPWQVHKTDTARPSDRRIQILDQNGNLVCEMAGTSKRDIKIAEEICGALNKVKYAENVIEE